MLAPFHIMVDKEKKDEDEEAGAVDELVNGNMVLSRRPGKFACVLT
jgi:hypothetical protein